MSVNVQPSAQFAEDVCKYFCGLPESKQIVILVSGGSSLQGVEQFCKHALDRKHDANLNRISISLIDERYDSNPHHGQANFVSLMSLQPIEQLQRAGVFFRPILRKQQTPQVLARSMSDWLEEKAADPNVIIVGIFGVGQDYHTAGIVPHHVQHAGIFSGDEYISYRPNDISISTEQIKHRITITHTGIDKIDQAYIYAAGEEKELVVNALTLFQPPFTDEEIAERPVLKLLQRGDLVIYTDRIEAEDDQEVSDRLSPANSQNSP